MKHQRTFIRLTLALAVLLAGVGGIGTVAAADGTAATDGEQPVDLTKLLKQEAESTLQLVKSELASSAQLIEDILTNGVTV